MAISEKHLIHLRKLAEKARGKPRSEETKLKISKSNKIALKRYFENGGVSWNKGNIGFRKGYKQSPEHIARKVAKITGMKRTDESKKRMSDARIKALKSGLATTWNKGLKLSDRDYFLKGENNPHYKGDSVGYSGVHAWVYKTLGHAKKCDLPNCEYPRRGKSRNAKLLLAPRRYEWANRSRKYLRDVNDWLQVCVSCHRYYDRNNLTL